jgi:tryptophan synthase alpha chain
VWQQLTQVRRRLPDTPVVLLVYPETVADLGWPDLIAGSLGTGVDGLVLTGAGTGELERVAAAGLSAIPLVRPGTPRSEADRLERVAAHLTYRPLAGRTGDPLDLSAAARAVAELAATAVRPFLVGFGIRSPQEVRRLARHAAGVVVGSHLLQVVGAAEADRRAEVLRRYLGAIKAATTVARRGDDGTSRTTDGPQA